MMFSILILTLNEERNLPGCLASVAACDDVVVLDSGSTDRTAEIARAAGARVVVRKFDDFAGQRNYAHREIPFKHPWVFHLDADEVMTPELLAECNRAEGRTNVDGFYVAAKMIFRGRWIPHCTDFPVYQARFVRVREFRFVQIGHGQREATDMRMGYLQESYLHDLMPESEEQWLEKHRRYARQEATEYINSGGALEWRDLLSGERIRRRRALKHVSYHLPFRAGLRFFYQYLLRRGFLDGRPGLRYCRLMSRYEQFTQDELRRLRSRRS